jgi:hypothetical protein
MLYNINLLVRIRRISQGNFGLTFVGIAEITGVPGSKVREIIPETED